MATLQLVFTKAIDWGYVSSNPARKVKLFPEKPSKLRVLSDEEFQKLYNSSSNFLKPILIVAVNTGLRRSEILNLKWEDINFKDGYLTVGESNNNDSRIIPMNKVLKETLKSVKDNSSFDYVFSNRNGESVKSIKKGFWAALTRSKIEKCRFHDLRHTVATSLVDSGIPLHAIAKLLGHSTIKITERYSHPETSILEAVQKLSNFTQDRSNEKGDLL